MNKPLSQVERLRRGQRVLSASDFNAAFDFLKALQRSINVAAPLELVSSQGGVHIALAGQVPPAGSTGDILYHDGKCWALLEPPGFDAVLYFNHSAGLPEWIRTSEDCPELTTTTTPSPTTEPPGTTTTAPPTTTTAPTTTTGGPVEEPGECCVAAVCRSEGFMPSVSLNCSDHEACTAGLCTYHWDEDWDNTCGPDDDWYWFYYHSNTCEYA